MFEIDHRPPIVARIHEQRVVGWQAQGGVPSAWIMREECSDRLGGRFTQWVRYRFDLQQHLDDVFASAPRPVSNDREEPSKFPYPIQMSNDEANRYIRAAVEAERTRRGLPALA